MISKKITFGSILASTITSVMAFPFLPSSNVRNSKTFLGVAVDPTTVTNKEYQDICGAPFDDDILIKRLQATNYLYPKHVEVIEDIAPIAGAMVDDVVSIITIGNNYWFDVLTELFSQIFPPSTFYPNTYPYQLLETGEKSWQPQDFLPDMTQDGWEGEVKELREMAAQVPDDVLVVLIGDMVNEI